MAAKNSFYVTATKILDGTKKAYTYNGTGLVTGVQRENVLRYIGGGTSSGEDTVIVMVDGTQITCQEELADFHTAVSSTNISGS